MSKGTPAMGKHNKVTHTVCRRCGFHAYNLKKSYCAHCGYPQSRLRKFAWQWKKVFSRARKK